MKPHKPYLLLSAVASMMLAAFSSGAAAPAQTKESKMDRSAPDIIIPQGLWGTPETHVRDLLELNRRYGFDRYMLVWPGTGWRSAGYPPQSVFADTAQKFKTIRDELARHGIRCGWWLAFTLKSGTSQEWSPVIRHDGTPSPIANCPLDPAYRKRYGEDAALVARIAKPEFIILEDDFSVAAAGRWGCFCPRHLAEFAKRAGKNYSREELVPLLQQETPEALRIRRTWAEVMRDSLVLFAADLRRAVDRESPEIPIGSMQSGKWDSEADATEAVTRALAGPRHTPFCRIHGAFYAGENVPDIPAKLFHALYAKQHVKPPFRFYYEADTYPHNAFYTSGTCMNVLLSSTFSMGYDGATFQAIQQGLDNPGEETAYGKMYASQLPRFRAICAAAGQCRRKGVRIPYAPCLSTNLTGAGPDWIKSVSHFGIPFTTEESAVTFLSGSQDKMFSDAELKALLCKGLILDAAAAGRLQKRGFGEYLGAEVGGPAITGKARFDLGGLEVIREGAFPAIRERRMRRSSVYSPGGNGESLLLTPKDPKCQELTRLVSFQGIELTSGMTWFENGLGGKVAIMGMTVENNNSVSLFNYRRMRIVQELVMDAADEFVMVRNAPRVYVIMNEAVDPAEAGFFGMLTITNLCPDPLESVKLHLPPSWKTFKEIQLLDASGEWVPCRRNATDDGTELLFPLPCAAPAVVRFLR